MPGVHSRLTFPTNIWVCFRHLCCSWAYSLGRKQGHLRGPGDSPWTMYQGVMPSLLLSKSRRKPPVNRPSRAVLSVPDTWTRGLWFTQGKRKKIERKKKALTTVALFWQHQTAGNKLPATKLTGIWSETCQYRSAPGLGSQNSTIQKKLIISSPAKHSLVNRYQCLPRLTANTPGKKKTRDSQNPVWGGTEGWVDPPDKLWQSPSSQCLLARQDYE